MKWTKFTKNVVIRNVGQQYIFLHWLEVVMSFLIKIMLMTTMTMVRQATSNKVSYMSEGTPGPPTIMSPTLSRAVDAQLLIARHKLLFNSFYCTL